MGNRALARVASWLLAAAIAGCGSSGSGMQSSGKTASKSGTPSAANSGGSSATGSGGSSGGSSGSGSSAGAAGGGAATAPGTGMTAGAAGMGGGSMGSAGAGSMQGAPAEYADPRGKCNIDSGFPDDNACILPPAPDEGMQIHIGPSDYNDPDQINKFLLKAGQEVDSCWTFHTPNDKDVYYQSFVLSGRAGSHHIINTMYNVEMTDGGFTACADPGTGTNGNIIDNLPGASKPFMPRMPVAPENANVGRMVPANTPSQADMHNFNFTQNDMLREFWMNIYFVDKSVVTEETNQIRGMGGLGWLIAPIAMGTDKTYSYSCPITADGRILGLLGHFHSHGTHLTASIQRASGDVEKVFEMYDYLDPAEFSYDSVTVNPPFSDSSPGASSGRLDVHAGDTLLWDCHIVNNDQPGGLTYTNSVKTGEMCNLWGAIVGPALNCVLP